VCRQLGIIHKQTTAYHPQANGLVERLHRQLKEALRAWLQSGDWELHLPWVLLGLRAAPKEDTALSAPELVFGTKLTLPGELLTGEHAGKEELVARLYQRQFFSPLPLRARTYADAALEEKISPQLMAAKHVYVRRGGVQAAFAEKYDGPYSVVADGP
jgi:transposase InsO family protein